MYRQGDVLLIPIDDAADGAVGLLIAESVARESGRVVLAHGEATGHAHAIAAKSAEMFELGDSSNDNGDRLLVLKRPVMLRHEEHAPIRLPAGRYIVRRQREYSPTEIRRVAD